MENEETALDSHDLDQLFSSLNILKIISDTDNFRSWLKSYHHIYDDIHLFAGYQFFLDAVICRFIDTIGADTAFDLEEDYTYYRAEFVGTPLDDMPVSCVKTKLIKNIWEHYRVIRDCQTWHELLQCISERNEVIFETFDLIFSHYVVVKDGKSKEQALWEKTLNYTLIFFNDTESGKPNAYPGTFIDSLLNEENSSTVFFGYLYSLQYLWFKLLGKTEFMQSPARDLHRAVELFDLGDEQGSDLMFIDNEFNPFEYEEYKKWEALDRFFSKLNRDVIEIKAPSGLVDTLILSDNRAIQDLNTLMNLYEITDPDYFSNCNSFPSIRKRLDLFFFWHEMDVLDTNKIHIFNGASAFISILIGEVEKYKIYNITEPIRVSRIKHPIAKDKNSISYGILLQSGGLITDTSGWLLFLDCGTDYSGSGGHIHAQIESYITKYVADEAITVKEVSVVSENFIQYLRQKRLPSLVRKIKITTSDIIKHADNSVLHHPSNVIFESIQSLNESDIEEISKQVEKIVFFLHLCIPNKPEYSFIRNRIDELSKITDISSKLEDISLLLPSILCVAVSDQLGSIESTLKELQISLSSEISARIIVSTGVDFLGSGIKYQIEIPTNKIAYSDISKDLSSIKGKTLKIDDLPQKLKNSLVKYLS